MALSSLLRVKHGARPPTPSPPHPPHPQEHPVKKRGSCARRCSSLKALAMSRTATASGPQLRVAQGSSETFGGGYGSKRADKEGRLLDGSLAEAVGRQAGWGVVCQGRECPHTCRWSFARRPHPAQSGATRFTVQPEHPALRARTSSSV